MGFNSGFKGLNEDKGKIVILIDWYNFNVYFKFVTMCKNCILYILPIA